jgi:hypothetical protein
MQMLQPVESQVLQLVSAQTSQTPELLFPKKPSIHELTQAFDESTKKLLLQLSHFAGSVVHDLQLVSLQASQAPELLFP